MGQPSHIGRKARKEHERLQLSLRKKDFRTCLGCDLCSATKARGIRKPASGYDINQRNFDRLQVQSLRDKIKHGLRDNLFTGEVIINPRHDALAAAAKEVNFEAIQKRLAYWTDGSRFNNTTCGIGIAYHCPGEKWTELSWRV